MNCDRLERLRSTNIEPSIIVPKAQAFAGVYHGDSEKSGQTRVYAIHELFDTP
jgi:hypothetical protein